MLLFDKIITYIVYYQLLETCHQNIVCKKGNKRVTQTAKKVKVKIIF